MEIVYYPHPALFDPTVPLEEGRYEDLEERIAEMFRLMYGNNGVGLAAPQVAWNARLFVANPTHDKKDELVLINPRITAADGRETGEEGCLSFPGVYAKVLRAKSITVEFFDEKFEPMVMECSDLLARIVQHELDHLENILLVHRMSEADKSVNRKKLKELKAAASE